MSTQRTFTAGDWAAATPDGCLWTDDVPKEILPCGIGRPGVLVEAKSARYMDEWGVAGTDQIPAYYLSQVYWQLHVSRAARCFVPVIGPFLDFSEYVVERDDEVGALLEAKCRAFYDSLQGDEPPEMDGTPATYDVMRRLHPAIEAKAVAYLEPNDAREYVEACLDVERATTRERLAKSRVLDVMGTANYADSCGARIARRQPNRSGVSLVRVAKAADAITDTQGSAA